MSIPNVSKTEGIDDGESAPIKQLLPNAAGACHTNLSEFLFNAGVTTDKETHADRHQFVLDETRWQAFQEALNRPVQGKPRLKKMLNEPGLLD